MRLEPRTATIDGFTYKVVFDLNAEAQLHGAIKKGLVDLETIADVAVDKLSPTAVAVLFWSGLASHHSDLSLVEFRSRHTPEGIKLITDALTVSRKDAEETIPEPENEAAFPTGGPR